MKKKSIGACLLLLCLSLTMACSTTTSQAPATTDVEEQTRIAGAVAEVDKYGNLIVDVTGTLVTQAGWQPGDVLTVSIGENSVQAPLGTSYSDVDTGALIVRDKQDGVSGLIVAINMGNAAETYGVAVGDEIAFSMSEPGGYLEEYEVRKLAASRTNERADYESDEAFANFRAITTTGIAPGRLYRSSSPINDELARAAFADALSKSAGITTVINLADSPEAVEGYFAQEGFSSEYYKSLYDSGKVITLDMGVDYSATDFQEKLAQGLRFIIENDGPYLIHCNEGKDRAGFTLMLLEAFTGAGIDEIKADHMLSFVNFYHLVPDSEQYQKTQTSNVVSLLENLTGAGVSVEQADLVASASEYLSAIGLTETEISELKAALTQ